MGDCFWGLSVDLAVCVCVCSNLLNFKMGIFFFRFFIFIFLYEACGLIWLMLFLHRTELMNG